MNKYKGLIFYYKKIKDNDLFIKILSSNDEVKSGMVYGGNSSKKKLIYQKGYFIDFKVKIRNINSVPIINGEIADPFLSNIYNDKYKLNALLSIVSLINVSILEGQNLKGLYLSVENLINNIIYKNHWIRNYCEWLFNLLQMIGYQIDYKKNIELKYFDIHNQDFTEHKNSHTIEFPHLLFSETHNLCYKNLYSFFIIFESIFEKNHLDNIYYKMPINFLNFKKIILNTLKDKYD